jgi:hypothetical protein
MHPIKKTLAGCCADTIGIQGDDFHTTPGKQAV